MRSGLRRYGVLTILLVLLSAAVAAAEPANAGQGKDKGGHGQKVNDGSAKQPPGLVGNVHAQAKGHEGKANESPADLGPSNPEDPAVEPEASAQSAGPARGKGQPKGGGGSSNEAHHHVIVCHRTGSASNPYVVLNIPWTAWSGAHVPGSPHAHPPLGGRVDVLLADPASRPGTKDGFTGADCRGDSPLPPPPPAPSPSSPPSSGGSGGALGHAGGSAGQGQLPFTGIPFLTTVLAGLALLGSGVGLRRSSRPRRFGTRGRDRRPPGPAAPGP